MNLAIQKLTWGHFDPQTIWGQFDPQFEILTNTLIRPMMGGVNLGPNMLKSGPDVYANPYQASPFNPHQAPHFQPIQSTALPACTRGTWLDETSQSSP